MMNASITNNISAKAPLRCFCAVAILLLFNISIVRGTGSITAPLSGHIPSVRDDIGILQKMETKYKGRVHCCTIPAYPHCDVVLCGTLHVAKTSSDMVRDVIQETKPDYIALEICEGRLDSLLEDQEIKPISISEVLKETISQTSLKTFGMGVLAWMQFKAAKVMGNKLGGELAVAAQEGAKLNAMVVLADRQYAVTMQRTFDRLRAWEKISMLFIMIWEVLTMTFFKLKDYIQKTETDSDFIQDEIKKFEKRLPALAEVIIKERDEYLAQTICEIARGTSMRPAAMVNQNSTVEFRSRQRIVAVVGAGHLQGIRKWLSVGGVNETRIAEISSSQKHASTWPGSGKLIIVNSAALFPSPPLNIPTPPLAATV